MIKRFFMILTVASALSFQVKAATESSPIGFWVIQDDDAVVQIVSCDSGLCGYLVGLRPGEAAVDYPKDTNNPDASVRGTSLCGLFLMGSLKPVDGKPRQWKDGWVYDPQKGTTYSVDIQLDSPDRLRLRGYVGLSLFGRTETWNREGANDKNRCNKPVTPG